MDCGGMDNLPVESDTPVSDAPAVSRQVLPDVCLPSGVTRLPQIAMATCLVSGFTIQMFYGPMCFKQ